MNSKPKNTTPHQNSHATPTPSPRQQLAQARQAHAKGDLRLEDYIWSAMQCYAAEQSDDDKQA